MKISSSTVYTLDMPKFVYIQVQGVDKPARIRADKVEKTDIGSSSAMLMLSNGGVPVGEFSNMAVLGWWIEDEPDAKK